jgi:hypothetical protein
MTTINTKAWSDIELEASVTAYFEMLEMEINGIPYKKTDISRTYLDGLLSNRSKAAFEFRMNGIASVFESLSLPTIKGYLPIKNSGASINSRIESLVIEKLSKLPTYNQEYVRLAVKSLSKTLPQASSNTINLISTVVNNILQRPDYQLILEHINTASKQDVSNIADAFNEFGLSQIAHLAEQAKSRSNFIDHLELLSEEPNTLEVIMHKAIENNLWIFGPQYTLFSSNKTLKKQIENYLEKKYIGASPKARPDLLLNESLNGEFLIIEFKRPSHALNLDDYIQAISYRHVLSNQLNKSISILLVGGSRAPSFPLVLPLTEN